MKLSAIGFFVKDLSVMRDFYEHVVGLKINVEMEGFVGFQTDDGFFFNLCQRDFIVNATDEELNFSSGVYGGMQVSYGVDTYKDVDKQYQRLIEAGAKAIKAPISKPYGLREAYVADPEGNLIEIVSSNEN